MIIVVKTIGVGKMSIGAAKLRSLLIHHFRKGVDGSGHMLGQAVGTFIGGLQHQGVEGLLHSQLLVLSGIDTAASRVDGVGRVIGIGHSFVQRAVLQGQKRSHDLRNAGRIIFHIHILIIKDGAAGSLHDDGRFRVDLRPLRPTVDGVRVDGLIISGLAFRLQLFGGSLFSSNLLR